MTPPSSAKRICAIGSGMATFNPEWPHFVPRFRAHIPSEERCEPCDCGSSGHTGLPPPGNGDVDARKHQPGQTAPGTEVTNERLVLSL